MATEIERLVAVLEARTTAFEKALAKAVDTTNSRSRQIEKRFEGLTAKVNSSVSRVASSLVPSLGAIAAALGAERILSYAEAWTAAQNALRTAGVSSDKVGATLTTVYEIAQRQGAALSPLVTLYGRVAQAGQELGASSGDVAQFTEGVATALRVAGTSSEEASGALLQLSQLLGAGTVRAEEFNSVMEGARPILQTVATGLESAGGSVSRLRAMVLAGTVSSRDFFQAFLRGMDGLEATASTATDTVGQALNRVTNALTRFIGQTDQSLGATQRIAQGLNALAKNFDTVGNAALVVGTAMGIGYVTNLVKARLEMLANAETAKAVVAGQQGIQKATGASAIALRALSGVAGNAKIVLGLLGGPVGAVITGLSIGLAVMSARSAESEARFNAYSEALKRAQASTANLATATGAAAKRLTETQTNLLNRGLDQQAADAEDVASRIKVAFATIATSLTLGKDQAGLEKLKKLQDGLGDTSDSAIQTKEELYRLANSEPRFQVLADRLAPLLDKLAAVRAATSETKTALQNVGPSAASLIDAQVGKLPPAADAQLDPTLRGAATTGYINEQTKAYRLAARERKLQADAESIYSDAQSKGIELTKKQARGIAEFRDQAEKADQSAEKFKGFQQGLKGYGLQTNELELEAKLIGASTFEATRQIEVLRMLNQAKMDQIALSPQMLATIDAEASKRAAATAAIEDAREKQQRFVELQQEFGDLGISGIQGLIEGTKSFNDVLKDGISLITQMLLKATLLGQGPLAGLFGGSVANSNGIGGLLGMAFGGFRADGGPVANGKGYVVGERGPEWFTPGTSGTITPNSAVARGGGRVTMQMSINLAGANGDAAIARAAHQAAMAGAAAALKATPSVSLKAASDNQKRRG
ncbi:tape measure protein [Azorhizobium sp. AG788]|uniref:tape measure protein n=1 Tax=Azorhizobium sp. AG788 TaxID=2183897 RepID=UPI00313954CF